MSHWVIPQNTVVTLREGDQSIVVWSLQKALNVGLTLDGDYGPATKSAVVKFQAASSLTADGIAGPMTQRKLVTKILAQYDVDLPFGLLMGFAQMEGGYLLGAVNWSVSGGVDCGVHQRRVYSADYNDDAVIQRAFDVAYQTRLLADRLTELRGIFIAREGTNDGYKGVPAREKAWRLAALNHNYPSAADRLSRTPIAQLGTYWTTAQSWVTGFGFRFPDGTPVRTPLEWTHLYAGTLAGAHAHKGNVTRYVTAWP